MILSPICLFTYNRLEETKKTVYALKQNDLANQSDLFIFSDGWKNEIERLKIEKVRSFLKTIVGFKTIIVFESPINKGLANSIIDGVTKVIDNYGKVIVLEDDIITSKGFLKYMNEGLDYYSNNKRVMQISAFMFPIDSTDLPDTFFYQANTCWGWGTWKDAWKLYNGDANGLLNELKLKGISWSTFNSMQGKEFQKQLLNNINGHLNTWAVKWHATIILNGGNVVHPKVSYVSNIGFAGNGENCRKGDPLGEVDNSLNLDVTSAIKIKEETSLNRLYKYFKKRYSFVEKCKRKIKSFL
jgi:hypothetical protein